MADDIVRDPKTNQIIYPGFQRGPGLHNASSYQVSAIPYLSGNLVAPAAGFVEIKFPTVTSWVKIDNLDPSEELRFAFSANGLKDNLGTSKYNVVLAATSSWNTSGQLSYKARSVFLASQDPSKTCRFQISAGLTHVLHDLSASSGLNWSGSAGVA